MKGQDDLDGGRVEHNPDPGSHGLGRQVTSELGADGPSVAVGSGHLKQHHFSLRK